ncbi:MAG: tetratricopeptide repeat protein [Halanaerobiales bacterium]|nr:tetratricopeptide repeat protein [Halanaerobiales bacterium]
MSFLEKGKEFAKKGLYREVIEEYSTSERVEYNNYEESVIRKAGCYYRIEEYKHAIRCLDGIIKSNPVNHEALNIKAMALFAQELYGEAIRVNEELIQLNDRRAQHEGYIGKAICLLRFGNIDEGEKTLKLALDHAKTNSEKRNVIHNMGWAKYLAGEYKEAKGLYLEAFAIDDHKDLRKINSYHSLAEVCIELDELDEANRYLQMSFEKIKNIKSSDLEGEYNFLVGISYKKQENYTKSLEYFNKARKMYDGKYINRVNEIEEEIIDIYTKKPIKEIDYSCAQLAYELYRMYENLDPSKAAGFKAIHSEIEQKYTKPQKEDLKG